ncbi:MaoC/PaaZ C-terminal domain-containing protein [Micromonospora sp. LOL_023]|uniref:MaoC/PaaZ C-terminal domain-containing protein n=1 Tax=Micromonospora sp. LOL_023 TaxID=3345418 RepID=UPI003A8C2583
MTGALRPRLPTAFAAGAVLLTPARTLTDGDFAAIVNVSWENGPLHTDAEYMRGTGFGRPILGGPCLIALAAGLTSTTMYAAWYAAGLDCHAALGIDEIRYTGPVSAGDTLRVRIEVTRLEPTPGGRMYVGVVHDDVRNQRDETVLRMTRSYLLRPLPEPESESESDSAPGVGAKNPEQP